MARPSGQRPPIARSPASADVPTWAGCALVFLVTVLAYLPALSGGFIWDDNGHVTRADLRAWAGLFRIWFEPGATQQYYPVLHSAFWLEHSLWGDSAFGYHLLNVLLHATAACLFGVLLRRLFDGQASPSTGPAAFNSSARPAGQERRRYAGIEWLAALLFALHPVGVESVAWISEQKNTLSAVFYLGAALAYLRFDGRRTGKLYAWATTLFLLALLTKTVTATLPAALLVIFWWQRGWLDWRRDVRPLVPWLVLGAGSGLFTAHFERELIGAQGADFALSALERCLLAGRVFWFYLGKLAWPADLTFIYPRWTVDSSVWWQWLYPLAGLALLAVLFGMRRRQRGLLAVVLLFGGTLFPVLGFVNVFPFLYSYVADHFQYLASLVIFALAAVGLMRILGRLPRWGRLATSAALLAILGGLTWSQAGMYRDAFTLYETTIARNPACWMAHNNLAIILNEAGRIEEAIPHLETAIRLKPDFPLAENNLGDDLLQLGRVAEALPHLERAVQLQPDYAVAHDNLGRALAASDQLAEAIRHFARAVQLKPDYTEAELNWAVALTLTNRLPEAGPHFEKAIALDPNSVDARTSYGRTLVRLGKFSEAIPQFEAALRLNPDDADTQMNLALVFRQLGRLQEAAQHYQEAVRLNPNLARQK